MSTSNLQHPTHVYTQPGQYTVSLTATGPGGTSTNTKVAYITVTSSGNCPPLSAGITATPQSGEPPLSVQFSYSGIGAPVSYVWELVGYPISYEVSPIFVLDATASTVFTMHLTVTDACGIVSTAVYDVNVHLPTTPFLIDDFTTPASQMFSIAHSQPYDLISNLEVASNALGGYRKMYLANANSPSDSFTSIRTGSDFLEFDIINDPSVVASGGIIWDGDNLRYVDNGTKITNIKTASIQNQSYDIEFVENSYEGLWPLGSNTAPFFWQNQTLATTAANTIATLLNSTSAPLGVASNPLSIFGIDAIDGEGAAYIEIPYTDVLTPLYVSAVTVRYNPTSLVWDVLPAATHVYLKTDNMADTPSRVYARFTNAAIDTIGSIGPYDITVNGGNVGFYLDLIYLNALLTITMRCWSVAGGYSSINYVNKDVIDFYSGIGPDYVFIPFNRFTGNVDFTQITAIQLEFNGYKGYRVAVYQIDTRPDQGYLLPNSALAPFLLIDNFCDNVQQSYNDTTILTTSSILAICPTGFATIANYRSVYVQSGGPSPEGGGDIMVARDKWRSLWIYSGNIDPMVVSIGWYGANGRLATGGTGFAPVDFTHAGDYNGINLISLNMSPGINILITLYSSPTELSQLSYTTTGNGYVKTSTFFDFASFVGNANLSSIIGGEIRFTLPVLTTLEIAQIDVRAG